LFFSKVILTPDTRRQKFTRKVILPKYYKQRKNGIYRSTFNICKALGIEHKTSRSYEGMLFPKAVGYPTPIGFLPNKLLGKTRKAGKGIARISFHGFSRHHFK